MSAAYNTNTNTNMAKPYNNKYVQLILKTDGLLNMSLVGFILYAQCEKKQNQQRKRATAEIKNHCK